MRNYLIGGSVALLGVVGTVFFSITPTVDVSEIRAVRLAADAEPTPEMCPAGIVDFGDKILCLTDAETDEGEIVNVPPGQKRDMLLCDVETEDDSGIWTTEVRYLPTGTLPPKCQVVCEDLLFPGLTMANIETGVEACLREVCAPCAISGGSWKACPHCLSDLTPTCAEACPVPEELEP